MLTRNEDDLSELTEAQLFRWRIAIDCYREVADRDAGDLSEAERIISWDRLRTTLGDVLRVLGDHFEDPDTYDHRHGRQ